MQIVEKIKLERAFVANAGVYAPRPRPIVALDLEMNQPSGKVIQIGAVVGDLSSGLILAELDAVIDPGEPISDFIRGLTGISDKTIAERGVSIADGYAAMAGLVKEYDCLRVPLTWGGGDNDYLLAGLKSAGLDIGFGKPGDERASLGARQYCFGRRHHDLKTIEVFLRMAATGMADTRTRGLAKTLLTYGMRFDGRKHDALDDARNTFFLAFALSERLRKAFGPDLRQLMDGSGRQTEIEKI